MIDPFLSSEMEDSNAFDGEDNNDDFVDPFLLDDDQNDVENSGNGNDEFDDPFLAGSDNDSNNDDEANEFDDLYGDSTALNDDDDEDTTPVKDTIDDIAFATPAKPSAKHSLLKQPSHTSSTPSRGLFGDDDDDDLFGGAIKAKSSGTASSALFDDDDDDNSDLFGMPLSTPTKNDKLFDDDDDEKIEGLLFFFEKQTEFGF